MSERPEPCYRLAGTVDFRNLTAVRREGARAIAGAGQTAVVDLSSLANGNSAAVAVLMAWLREANALDKPIIFTGAPERLRKIIELSGLDEVLPVEDAGTQSLEIGA